MLTPLKFSSAEKNNSLPAMNDDNVVFENPARIGVIDKICTSLYEQRNLIVLTGESGTGKSLIIREVTKRLDKSILPIFFWNSHLTFDEIMSLACNKVGISQVESELGEKIRSFKDYVKNDVQNGKSVVFFIDSAQDLAENVLSRLLHLSKIQDYGERPLMQITLVGLPKLRVILTRPELAKITAGSVVHLNLEPLKFEEISGYIRQQLHNYKLDQKDLFTSQAIERIAIYTKGVPRLVSTLVGSVLAFASSSENNLKTISAESVDKTVDFFSLSWAIENKKLCAHLLNSDSEQDANSTEKLVGDGTDHHTPFNPEKTIQAQLLEQYQHDAKDSKNKQPYTKKSRNSNTVHSKSEDLDKVLYNFQKELSDVEAAAFISEDGHPIASSLPKKFDVMRVGGMSATLLSLGVKAADEFMRGDIQEVIVRSEQGYTVLAKVASDLLLLVVANENAKLGMVFYAIDEVIVGIKKVL